MSRILFIIPALLVILSATASAQTTIPRDLPDASSSSPSSNQRAPRLGSPAEEIIRRAEIKHAEEQHQEMVERADETVELAGELHAAFQTSKALNREDLKKLERMEKLARKIRGSAGGDDDKLALKETPPHLGAAVELLNEISSELKKGVSKTSRLVVSGAVIERSNELIELIRFIRTSVQK
ncbi:MAG TPA: hypothetical protein VFS10_15225 [Pyrinomonadaceae bacterium]|nr:hypothetical protein [Pyrinomonadaceae bacterium]